MDNVNSTEQQSRRSYSVSPAVEKAYSFYKEAIDSVCRKLLESAETKIITCEDAKLQNLPGRLDLAMSYYSGRLVKIFEWLFDSNETTNFTYDLTEKSKSYLISTVSMVTGKTYADIAEYVHELENDIDLKSHIERQIAASPLAVISDSTARYGRRIGWYAVARAMKPRVIVETGIDKGLGCCVLSAALLKNKAEGFPGYYYGTDLNPQAGFLYTGAYRTVGEILYGDSIQSLLALDKKIDLFINDSDHSAEYEAQEYQTIHTKLADGAVLLGDNAHVTNKLLEYARATGRSFLYYAEEPLDHWYPGAGVGFAFSK